VKISGEVKGNITSTGNVHYMEDCSVTGDTTTSRILIEDGATIKGSVHIDI
jgi:cytoskeletal protein CcmA (bactofilin family)